MTRGALGAALVGLALALALFPAAAGAATFSVNVDTDAPDAELADLTCDSDAATAGSQCSLRAAVETANVSISADTVNFSLPAGTTITLDSPLQVTGATQLAGCAAVLPPAPCIGLRGSAPTFTGIVLDQAGATLVRGLAMTNFRTALATTAGTPAVSVKSNWFGITIAGAAEANSTGTSLAGNNAIVGGITSPKERNVFADNGIGVRVFGGDGNKVFGDYVGVMPDGTTAAGNGIGVLVASAPSDLAENNVVGARVSAAAAATPECDGVCNVISGGTWGVNLSGVGAGESPSIGTSVRGNFIGLDAAGAAAQPNLIGVQATGAESSFIGGLVAEDRNVITGGSVGVRATASDARVSVLGNSIGLDSTGAAQLSPPSDAGIEVTADYLHASQVMGNRIAMGGGTAILVGGTGESIRDNVVGLGAGEQDLGGGSYGIRLQAAGSLQPPHPLTVAGNTVDNSEAAAIVLEASSAVTLTGNRIGVGAGHGNGGPGIELKGTGDGASQGNAIGGPDLEANQIENSAGPAIEIEGDGQDQNQVLDNSAAANQSFVDLAPPAGPGNDPDTGPNAGIQAPAFLGAGESFAAGTALPEASVRVYVSPSAAGQVPTGVDTLLGTVSADSAGRWSLTYPTSLAADAVVTAAQTDAAGNSSELSLGSGLDTTPPEAPQITGGPGGVTNQTAPTFSFSGDASAGFRCAIDGDPPVPCDGGTFTPAAPLDDGGHAFHVVQVDLAGNVGPEALRGFLVDTTAPAAPQITGVPANPTNKARPSFSFKGESGASFRCAFDADAPAPCSGSFRPANPLGEGAHAFHVSQVDAAGNPGPEASGEVTIDLTAPAAPRITAAPAGPTNQPRPGFEFEGEPGASFRCAIDGDPPVPCDGGSFTPATPLADGSHTLHVSQIDRAGNAGPEATGQVTVDLIAPAPPQITAGPSGATAQPAPGFEFDGEAGAGFRCAIDGDAAVACDGGSFTPSGLLADGSHAFRVSQIDVAGNAGAAASRGFVVDTTPPPAPRVTAGPVGPTREVRPSFGFEGEPGASFRCAIDGNQLVPCDAGSFAPAVALPDGPHIFYVGQTDAVGNVGPEAEYEFRVDTTPPPAPAISGGPSGPSGDATPPETAIKGPKRVLKQTAKFKLSSTEVGSSFQCKLGRAPFAPCAATYKATHLAPGRHVLTVRAVDAAGNVDPTPAKKRFRVAPKGSV